MRRLPRARERKWPALRRVGLRILAVVAALAVVVAILGVWAVRRSYPQYGGQLRLPGLSAPVTVHRDGYGIPNVYASTEADLFRAQGYLHAQDRFWEMDFRRHVTAGRLAELFGADQLETDTYLRTMGWRRVAEREWEIISPSARGNLSAYADGVNAWLDQHGGRSATGAKSLEYTLLGLQNSGYEVEPWTPVDSLAWLKAMAWDLRGNMESEIRRAALAAHGLSHTQVDELYPAYPYERNMPIVDAGRVAGGAFDPRASAGVLPLDPGVLDGLAAGLDRLPIMIGKGESGIGSNSWVIAGSRTTTGKPILANDPHLSPSMPGIWHQMGLHCSCGYESTGFTFSGVPGVVIGHNARIAWGFTNLDPDVSDLYLERVDGDRYEVDGAWRALDRREEVLMVAGGDPVTITVRATKHGPLLSDASADLRKLAGEHAIALRWTALDPGRTIEAVFAVNRARDWTEARAAARLFEVPAQNIVYADVDGNVGYQSPGRVPVRGNGDGRWMAPGWDSSYDWTGYVPFDELPSVLNPSSGYVVTANQAVIGPQYEHLLTHDWSYGYRSQRINDMLRTGGKVSVADVQRMQFDNRNGLAPTLVPVLLRVPLPASRFAGAARDLLRDWDYQQPADGARDTVDARRSAAAAYFNAVWRHLLLRTFDELPEDHRPDGGDRWFEVVRGLLSNVNSPWWDDRSTPATEDGGQMLAAAMVDAAVTLRDTQGDRPEDWRWGRMHTLTVRNATFGTSGIAPVEWLFNRGPAQVAGGDAIVNATGWNAAEGYEVDAVPSMRMIVDLSNLDGSRWVQLTGNSGHAFHPNYHDQFELWRTGGTLPMRWSLESVRRAATDTLTLRP